MQTILGSGGAIGIELAKVLTAYTNQIRLVSRNPKKVNETDTLLSADLTKREEVFNAISGSEIVFVTVGFEYSTQVWQKLWVPFIENVIDGCLQHNAKLVFFDNVYAIGVESLKHITETSPLGPVSKKGIVRAAVDNLILDAIAQRNLQAIIARSPDFFGIIKDKSMLMISVYDKLIQGKKAQWFCNAKVGHTFGYTPDLAKGMAMLGNTKEAFNQIWNLPTDAQNLTGEEWIKLFAHEMNTSNTYSVLPGWLMKLIGIFVPILKELHEMSYQFDQEYFFDSSKFKTYFNFVPTSNAKAVSTLVKDLKAF